MKTKEELSALAREVKAMNAKLAELNEDELAQVSGGLLPIIFSATPTAGAEASDEQFTQ